MESRLKKYISSLTEEEKTLYKPLIEDALRRDKALTLAVAEAKEHAAMYEFQMGRLSKTAAQFQSGIQRLNRSLEQLAELSGRAYAKSPDGPAAGNYSTLRH